MKSLKGSLLIASPNLLDANFVRTVVLLAEHNAEGAFGLVLNRKASRKVADLWFAICSESSECEAHAFVGGPVQENAVLFLHGIPQLATDTEPVVPGVYLGNEADLLGELIRRCEGSGGDAGALDERPPFRVFCGYSGWGGGQLESELRLGSWLVLPASRELVFETPPERLWSVVMDSLGGVYKFFAQMPQDPDLN